MFNSLSDRTKDHFKNALMLAATFMDPRYRSFRFIKDQEERDMAKFKAMAYIKGVYGNLIRQLFKKIFTKLVFNNLF